ncbi:Uncharacterized conserved protein, DUF1501 family [Gemmobacter megaterium]|uniref:Uncharacterized conserved protein, DUF1501 family n=1 Tax=Gemmobacter megaterium TaxID=1086013 RepID=A0A1N7PFB0_9RHOB|nr:DUF1501 domain-containing protein [Gemmobacter megaterium]GGE18617.1 hypothetical protein GCM10011345_25610 [Gemmobacter megaterium]SIT09227.1 Uncharacterized conserved protein, DUF1501 family [Gemmobacter megaterium]
MTQHLNRRGFLRGGLALGCSAAAFPLISHATFAAAPFDHRLIVVILRGAMDGLDVIRPVGDRNFRQLRPELGQGEGPALDNFWQLHPGLSGLMPLWQAGELGFVQAVSTPYRDQRSHFDGQDMLEAGTAMDSPPEFRRDGWMNRLLAGLPGARSETAFAVGREALPILSGPAPAQRWAPETEMRVSPQARRLLEQLYEADPPFHSAAGTALELTEMLNDLEPMDPAGESEAMMAPPPMMGLPEPEKANAEVSAFAAFAAARLREDTRIVALSLAGWDTHAGQDNAIRRPLARLEQLILELKAGLGPVWNKTAFIAMTEFGRTVRQNGTKGTDHGTGGAMITAGGAIRGGRVLGQWPGLGDSDLYAGRDLTPTGDVRAVAAWVIHGLMGIDKGALQNGVFPGLDMGTNPGIV